MEPKEFDLEFPRGDTCPLTFVLNDAEGNVLIPTLGDELYFTVKKSYTARDVVFQKKYTTGDLELNDGLIKFAIKHEDTANLSYGSYVFDIQFKGGDFVKTLVKGTITLTEEATSINNE